jgi:hypothetical protein
MTVELLLNESGDYEEDILLFRLNAPLFGLLLIGVCGWFVFSLICVVKSLTFCLVSNYLCCLYSNLVYNDLQ